MLNIASGEELRRRSRTSSTEDATGNLTDIGLSDVSTSDESDHENECRQRTETTTTGGVDRAKSCCVTYQYASRLERNQRAAAEELDDRILTSSHPNSNQIFRIDIQKPLSEESASELECSVYGIEADTSRSLYDYAKIIIHRDGVMEPEVRFSDITYLTALDVDSIEIKTNSDASSYDVVHRCMFMNSGKYPFGIDAQVRGNSCRPQILFATGSFNPLDAVYCSTSRDLHVVLDLDERKSYSLLMWTPESTTRIVRTRPDLCRVRHFAANVKVENIVQTGDKWQSLLGQ